MEKVSLPPASVIRETVSHLEEHGISVITVATKEEALAKVKELIPTGSTIMNGSSTTLKEIGFIDWLKSGDHGLHNLHKDILKEEDKEKKDYLRRKSVADADYFLASVNAITEDGALVACDMSGSRVGAFPFAAKKLLLVAGVQKIVPDIAAAMKRIREHVFPLENERAKKVYGVGSNTAKWVIIEREFVPKRITLILVNQSLGF